MTPEEKFNKEVWWILQEIKKEQLATPKGEKVYFPLRLLPKTSGIKRKDVDYDTPQADTQRKLLYKLKEWEAFDLKQSDLNFDDLIFPPTAYLLTIFENKFNELYRIYETKNQKVEIKENKVKNFKEQIEEFQKEIDITNKITEEFKKQISSQDQRDFSVPLQYFNYQEEISKRISEQLAPLKDALERIGRAQQVVKTSLTPALQRLAPSLKQFEEQIKEFNELYKAPDHSLSEAIISPDLIRMQQGAEMISELRKVRKLIEKSTIKKDEPRPIKWFNHKNNSINFYGNTYKPRSEPQAKFIRQLVMRHQRENNNGTVLKQGQRVSEKILSSEINMTIEQLRHIKKQLKRSFKDKGFPLKIDFNTEGVLLIYTI